MITCIVGVRGLHGEFVSVEMVCATVRVAGHFVQVIREPGITMRSIGSREGRISQNVRIGLAMGVSTADERWTVSMCYTTPDAAVDVMGRRQDGVPVGTDTAVVILVCAKGVTNHEMRLCAAQLFIHIGDICVITLISVVQRLRQLRRIMGV